MARKTKREQIQVVDAPKAKEENLQSDAAGKNDIFDSGGELVVDVFETHSDFVVLAAIAGVKIQDLDIAVEKDMMVIKGNRLNPDESHGRKYFYQECYWGPFSKKVVLPENVDTKEANAQIDKGILTIKIPKIITEKTDANVEIS